MSEFPRMVDPGSLPDVLTDEIREQLSAVSTATLTHQLQMRGIRSTFLSGLRPTHPELRMIGRARTLRYVALREDVTGLALNGRTAQKQVVETVRPGDIVVMEARGVPDAGTIGDIFAMRVKALGGAGVITDGALRDTPAIAAIDLPVYHQSSHASTYGRQHMPYSVDDSITCAGVFVQPGDIVVGDAEGRCRHPPRPRRRGRRRGGRPGGGRGVRHRARRGGRVDGRRVPAQHGAPTGVRAVAAARRG